jgi:prolyl-tRNA synthetase
MSRLFSQTMREAPAEAEAAGHQLLLRAGFVRQLAAGIFSTLPLGQRSLAKIEGIMRQEIGGIGGQEIKMPVVHPADLWQESGRWYEYGDELGRFKDRNGRDMVLGATHEEVVTDLARREIHSYRQLPQLVYQIQTKWRDDPRPRAGLIRAREFTMLDSYSLDADEAGLDRQYQAHYEAYFRIFGRCALPVIAVEADVGMMGGTMAHEYMYLTPIGEDTLLLCDNCGYRANRQIATFQKPAAAPEAALAVEKVATPDATTIAALAAYLGVPKAKIAKTVMMMATVVEDREPVQRLVLAVVRGDMELNETKLANAIKAQHLRPARDEEIRATGAEPGYASPVGLAEVIVVVDDAVVTSPNLVAGANEASYHLLNVNAGRDIQANVIADLAAAGEGDACPKCGRAMRVSRGVEAANIFKLGTRYSLDMGATFADASGEVKPIIMGSYGIGVGRLLGCIAEQHRDEQGLVWPVPVAPYQAHLVALRGGEEAAELLYGRLQDAGVEVLYDDRDESSGVKFNDADLIGVPVRLTVSRRSLGQGGVEMRLRHDPEPTVVPLPEVVAHTQTQIAELEEAIFVYTDKKEHG